MRTRAAIRPRPPAANSQPLTTPAGRPMNAPVGPAFTDRNGQVHRAQA
jgi:hypothetical protein